MQSDAARIAQERRIVAGLLAHMQGKGWRVSNIFDGEQHHFPRNDEAALGIIFNLDEASVRFIKAGKLAAYRLARKLPEGEDCPTKDAKNCDTAGGDWWAGEHGVLLVLGNGEDIVSDWNYLDGDADGFDAAMTAFKSEDHL